MMMKMMTMMTMIKKMKVIDTLRLLYFACASLTCIF